MLNPGVPLHEAPELFFDQVEWNKLIGLCGTPARALERMSLPHLGWLAFQQDGAPLEAEQVRLAYALAEQFKQRLLRREIVANGYLARCMRRKDIPPEHWIGLELNFAEDRATGRGDIFEDVRLSRPETLEASAGSLLDECILFTATPVGGSEPPKSPKRRGC